MPDRYTCNAVIDVALSSKGQAYYDGTICTGWHHSLRHIIAVAPGTIKPKRGASEYQPQPPIKRKRIPTLSSLTLNALHLSTSTSSSLRDSLDFRDTPAVT